MNVSLQDIGKKFYGRWLFREIKQELKSGERLALVGSNGSGKSTLLRIIAGQMNPSEGRVIYHFQDKKINGEQFFQHLSWSGPYIDLYQDLTFEEHLKLHFRFKKCLLDQPEEIIDILNLRPHKDKKLRFYSSGMQQRAKVGLALFTQSNLLLLDEPTSNMDADNAKLMLDLIETHLGDRILVLASNMEREFHTFEQVLRLN